jgi:intracellular sulfur oxidation DsrE/DsrF family protein
MNKKMSFVTMAAVGILGLFLQGVSSATYAQTSEAMAENTKPPLQIVNQTGIKVVVQVNSSDTVPNGIGKQVLAVKNLHDQYAALGMAPGKDYEIVMVFRGDGARFLLTDEAYDAKVKQPHPKGNPNRALIEALHQGGVKMYECGVAMRMLGYEAKDIFPFSRIVVSGIGALVDFEKSGYLPMTP